jgi:hypothetical protein
MRSSGWGVLLIALLACSQTVRIDASSRRSFIASHTDLVQSLSPADQARLVMAEMVIRAAATPKTGSQPTAPNHSIVPLEAVLGELDGMTFSEILALANTKKTTVRAGFISEPGIEDRAVAVVTLSEESLRCIVRRTLQDPGQETPCNEVGGYLRDGLKIACGAFVGITIQGGPPRDGMLALFNELSAHGFTSVGSVGFIRECDRGG